MRNPDRGRREQGMSEELKIIQNEVLAKMNAPQPCGDCISREKALQIIRAWFDREATPSDLKNEIEQLPPVTPQPKIGRWIEHIHNGMHYIECPKCSSWFLRMYLTRNSYCPNCGAKMQEVEE